mmetsp:Transcript_34075/g.110064  ORF Transcript_34075/g.110064 Transcript_34075/m.110064 type:complete len:246 (+) Transcript_34075:1049-1786(+)
MRFHVAIGMLERPALLLGSGTRRRAGPAFTVAGRPLLHQPSQRVHRMRVALNPYKEARHLHRAEDVAQLAHDVGEGLRVQVHLLPRLLQQLVAAHEGIPLRIDGLAVGRECCQLLRRQLNLRAQLLHDLRPGTPVGMLELDAPHRKLDRVSLRQDLANLVQVRVDGAVPPSPVVDKTVDEGRHRLFRRRPAAARLVGLRAVRRRRGIRPLAGGAPAALDVGDATARIGIGAAAAISGHRAGALAR